jgi:sugar phosphate isomerase/epimerase
VGVRLALEVIPNEISRAGSLVSLIEDQIDADGAGICLDTGHAHIIGDATEAIEACSGHIVTTHLHDNRKRSDDHLVPYDGTIDWDAALLAFQKVGYDGAFIFELAISRDPGASLEHAARARARFETLLKTGDGMSGPA